MSIFGEGSQQASAQAQVDGTTIYGQSVPKADPSKYTSLGDFIDEVNAPDIRAKLIKTYGDQGITGFLKLTGAVNSAGTADEVTWWEEARLHQTVTLTVASDPVPSTSKFVAAQDRAILRKHDVILYDNTSRGVVTDVDNSGNVTIVFLQAAGAAPTATAEYKVAVVGSTFGQGQDQNDKFMESNVIKRTNPYIITKEIYKVTGSQATNIGYVDLGNGDYRWYIKGEMDTRQRFMDKREMMLLLGQKPDAAAVSAMGADADALYGGGAEGYFDAIQDRGIVTSDVVGQNNGFADLDEVIKELDKNGAPAEYAFYCNTDQSLTIDDMLGQGYAGTSSAAGLAGSFGAFQNNQDMAINLGFKSFTRGGYTFHKHDWRLLNDPNLLGANAGANSFAGVMVPLASVADAKTGNRAPSLEMNYKAANGYSREMEHWVTGGGVLGFTTDTKDVAQFNYRSECNLCVRAAEQHVLIKGISTDA